MYPIKNPGVVPSIRAPFCAQRFQNKWFKQPAFDLGEGKSDWFHEVTPTKAQTQSSCVFRGTMQAIMALAQRQDGPKAIPKGYILDGDWLHRKYCDERGIDYMQGAQVEDGYKQAMKEGVLEGKFGIAHVPIEGEYIDKMLRVTPLLIGLALTPGWGEPDKFTGRIPNVGIPNIRQGHLVTIVDYQRWPEGEFVVICNSWGLEWGRYGYCVLSLKQLKQQAISDIIALYAPDGIGKAYKDFLVKV